MLYGEYGIEHLALPAVLSPYKACGKAGRQIKTRGDDIPTVDRRQVPNNILLTLPRVSAGRARDDLVRREDLLDELTGLLEYVFILDQHSV